MTNQTFANLRRLVIGSLFLVLTIPSYSTTCEIEQRRARVKTVCGEVRDLSDSLTDAAVSLLREDGSLLATVKTHDGKFDFGPVPKGDYLVRVEESGFMTAERKLTVTRDPGKRCKSTIMVRLGPGVCGSSMRVKGFDK